MEKYEIMYLFSPEIPEKEVKTEIDQTNTIIKKLGGEITKEDFLGLKNLAYPIKHREQGYYHVTWCKLASAKLSSLEQKLKTHGRLLRFLITKLGKKEPAAIKVLSREALQTKLDHEADKTERREIKPQTLPTPKAPGKLPKKKVTKPLPFPPSQTKQKEASTKIKKEKSDLQELDKKLDEILNEEVI